ncbi:MAG: aldehyde dehydrogenase family protein, partial [Dechloromonas sp.]|nr:aldehyde dehydrogenase family protein [Dechloromonas sp.]
MNLQNTDLLRSTGKIGQNWNAADDGSTFAVINPASGEQIGEVPLCGAAETRRAIDAANAAWPAWRALTARRRAQILQGWNR